MRELNALTTQPSSDATRRPGCAVWGKNADRGRMNSIAIQSIIDCSQGATAIEYAFIASLISIAIYAAAMTIGTDLSSVFSTVASSL